MPESAGADARRDPLSRARLWGPPRRCHGARRPVSSGGANGRPPGLGDTEATPILRTGWRAEPARHRTLLLGAVLLAITPSAGSAQDGHRWKTYTNARFGYSVCYPTDLLAARPESDNGDGRAFEGADGSRVTAWASYNVLDSTVSKAAQMDEERLAGKSGTISYKVVRADFYVLSGKAQGMIFYHRTALVQEAFSTVEILYPAAQSATWDPIAARISRCFRSGQ